MLRCLDRRWFEWGKLDDSEFLQQALGLLEVPLSLRLIVSRPTKFDVGKGGLEGHADPLGGDRLARQARCARSGRPERW